MNTTSTLLSQRARMFASKGQWDQVFAIASEMQSAFPTLSEGFFMGGLSCKRMRQLPRAQVLFEQTLRIDTNRYDAAIELAEIYYQIGKFSHSVELLDKYQGSLNNSSYYLVNAASIYTRLGLHQGAWQLLSKANDVQPNTDKILAALADASVLLGRTDIAVPIYRRLIDKYPDYHKHHYEYSKLSKAQDWSHVDEMKRIISSKGLPDEKNIYLFYALGKELEDLGQWKDAFSYFERAGNAILKGANYTVAPEVKLMKDITRLCTKQWIERHSLSTPVDNSAPTPIFVVGLPRTGTTLIERVLSSHSTVDSADETFFLPMAMNKSAVGALNPDVTDALLRSADSIELDSVARDYFEMVSYRLSGNQFFIDKYPFNFLLLGFIACIFPHAKIVYLDRNPMDACFALFKQSYFKFAYSLKDLSLYYQAYYSLRQHWNDVLGDRLISVSYEHFVSDQEGETKRLLERVGLPFEASCLNFHENSAPSGTASTLQVREKAHTRSINKWKKFEEQLSPLASSLSNVGIQF